jgi:alpha-L-fucosidase 2
LLPALPRAWRQGSLHGVRARGGIELDIDWDHGRVERLVLRGPPHATVKLRYEGRLTPVALGSSGRLDVPVSRLATHLS